jgi:phospholipid/cholesterol/gamma-HCH transport system substrate-binding protein
MRRSWASVTVGILAVIVLAGAYSLFMYTGERNASDGYLLHAYFNDALGLFDKSGVRSAGIDVGKIESKVFDHNTGKAKIAFRINPDIVIYDNAVVSKRSASLLGEFYLQIDPGTPVDGRSGSPRQTRVLKDGDEIRNVNEATNVGEIIEQVNVTLPILQEILKDVQEITSGPIKQMANNANDLVARNSVVLERLLLRVDNIAKHVESVTASESDDVKVTLRNVREISEGLKTLVGKSEGEVSATGEKLRSSVDSLRTSVETLERSLGNVETVTERLKDGEGTAGKLLADDSIANNIEQITEDAGGFVRSLTRLQTVVGVRTEYNYLSNTLKNYFSVRLAPRPDKFYLIEIVDDPRGFREVVRTTTQSSDKNLVEETVVKNSLDKLRFSLMLGKRFGALTGRFGIKESTGGMGVDFHFIEDRLTLSFDLFDTRSNEYPRLQGRSTMAIYNHNLFLIAGVDDVLNQTRAVAGGGAFFDWFFGLQLLFRDEDLKSMLWFGGGALGAAGGGQ